MEEEDKWNMKGIFTVLRPSDKSGMTLSYLLLNIRVHKDVELSRLDRMECLPRKLSTCIMAGSVRHDANLLLSYQVKSATTIRSLQNAHSCLE